MRSALPDPEPAPGRHRAGLPDPSLGVFETLRVRDRRVQALDAHLARLAGSVSDLYGLELPARIRATVADQARALAGEHRLRIDAIPASGPALRVELQSSPVDPVRPGPPEPVCRPVIVPGGLGRHKWRDRRRLDELGVAGSIALLVDRDGDVLEAAWANLWLLEPGRLVTPPADGRLLPGVTRALLLQHAPLLGLEAREEPISLARAATATAIFLTSSLRLAVAVGLEPNRPPASPAGDEMVAAIRAALTGIAWD